jgi:hypothetical protein
VVLRMMPSWWTNTIHRRDDPPSGARSETYAGGESLPSTSSPSKGEILGVVEVASYQGYNTGRYRSSSHGVTCTR